LKSESKNQKKHCEGQKKRTALHLNYHLKNLERNQKTEEKAGLG